MDTLQLSAPIPPVVTREKKSSEGTHVMVLFRTKNYNFIATARMQAQNTVYRAMLSMVLHRYTSCPTITYGTAQSIPYQREKAQLRIGHRSSNLAYLL